MSAQKTCRTWRGNAVPHPDRHTDPNPTFLVPRAVRLSWITACDLCAFTRVDDIRTPAAEVEQRRVDHLGSAHLSDLTNRRATLHLTNTRRPA